MTGHIKIGCLGGVLSKLRVREQREPSDRVKRRFCFLPFETGVFRPETDVPTLAPIGHAISIKELQSKIEAAETIRVVFPMNFMRTLLFLSSSSPLPCSAENDATDWCSELLATTLKISQYCPTRSRDVTVKSNSVACDAKSAELTRDAVLYVCFGLFLTKNRDGRRTHDLPTLHSSLKSSRYPLLLSIHSLGLRRIGKSR
jgi:hypothetical protein